MKHRIVLYDTDPDYSRRLGGFIRESSFRKDVELTVCTSSDAFADCLKREEFDVLVVNVELAGEIRNLLVHHRKVIWLTESMGGTGPEGFPMLQKYQQVPGLIQQFIRMSGRKRFRTDHEASRVPVVAVWSAAGGVGKTKLTSALAGTWAGKGLRLFVIGVDPGIYESSKQNFATYHDVSEWLYAVKSGRGVDDLFDHDHSPGQLHYFSPVSPYEEFIRINRAETSELLRLVSSTIPCDAIVVDAGTGWSSFIEEVLSRCDVLLAVCSDDPTSKRKTEKWIQEWDSRSSQGKQPKGTIYVLNKCLQEQTESDFTWENQAFRLPYVPEWKQDGERFDPVFQQCILQLSEEVWDRCRSL